MALRSDYTIKDDPTDYLRVTVCPGGELDYPQDLVSWCKSQNISVHGCRVNILFIKFKNIEEKLLFKLTWC